jgi:amino acid transporter
MSWYSIFYWITVADGVKEFFDTFSNIFTFFSILTLIIVIISFFISRDDSDEDTQKSGEAWLKWSRKLFIWFTIFMLITWIGYVFCPNKRDALIIVAGGAVGEFITSDTAAKQIPSEVMVLLRDKIRSEIKDIKITDAVRDTLENKTKEELLEMLRKK